MSGIVVLLLLYVLLFVIIHQKSHFRKGDNDVNVQLFIVKKMSFLN